MVLLILPCSARKPYFKSSSHKRFFNAIRKVDNHLALHVVSVTSPLGLVPRELEFCYPAAHYDIAVTGKWNASEIEMLRSQLAKLNPTKHYVKAIIHAGSSSEIMTELVKELGIDVVDTRVERPSSFEGLEILQNIARMTLSDIPILNTKDRAKGEAKGLAKFQYGDNADFLVNSEISGRMPYKLRCGDLAAMSPVVGGFGLTLKGGIEYSSQGGPVIAAENFKLVGDLFAVGVKSYKGNWNIGDQVVIKQNDVVTALNGLSIEIVHTDAEGRMVLADTLTMASRKKPQAIIDFATLTGCMHVAMGDRYSGVISNQSNLACMAVGAGAESGERISAFPYDEDYEEDLVSQIADIKQCNLEGGPDHIHAARFLGRFVENNTPWLHVDLSSSNRKGGLGAISSDVNGFGVSFGIKMLEILIKK